MKHTTHLVMIFLLLILLTLAVPHLEVVSSDSVPPVITHFPVTQGVEGRTIYFYIQVSDDVQVSHVVLYYRRTGEQDYTAVATTKCQSCIDVYDTTIPASVVTASTIEYYINATDGINFTTDPATNPTTHPHIISVNLHPAPVVLNSPTCITQNSLKLNWTQSTADDFKNYTVYKSNDPNILGTPVHTLADRTTTCCNITDLTAGAIHYFTIRVYDTVGLFADSNQVIAKTSEATLFSWTPFTIVLVIIVAGSAAALIARVVRRRKN